MNSNERINAVTKEIRSKLKEIDAKEVQRMLKNVKISLKKEQKLTILIRIEGVLVDIAFKDTVPECEALITKNCESEFLISQKAEKPSIVKVRSGAEKLINEIKDKYIISFITSLEPLLAKEIIDKICTDGESYSDRIFFDSEIAENEKIIQNLIFPGTEEMGLILDTSSNLWKKESGLLLSGFIFVTPYFYFEKTDVVKVTEKISLPTNKKNDYILYGISQHLQSIHMYYYIKKVDTIVGSIDFAQRTIFRNLIICITFVDQATLDSLDILSSRFGGKVVGAYDPTVTHLIVEDHKDPAIAQANNFRGVYVINKQWMIDSCTNYQRKEEGLYPVIGVPSPTEGNKTIEQPSESSELSSSELDLLDMSSSDSEKGYLTEEEEEELEIEEMMRANSLTTQ